MRRAIRRLVGSLKGPRRIIFFIVLAMVCAVALSIGIYIQFYYQYSDVDPLMLGINIGSSKTEEEISVLKANFNSLFNNSLILDTDTRINVERNEINNQNLVYTAYTLANEDESYYSVNAQIPIINIKSDLITEINKEIKSEFYDKANSIMRQKKDYTTYNVTYEAYVNGEVLSLIIKSSLKEKDKTEKVVVKTYNYSIKDDAMITLEDLIEAKGLDKSDVQKTINKDVQTAYTNAKMLAAEYGSLYERDLSNEMYLVENTNNFFLTQDGYVYVVYAYGNNDYTNEIDLVIF